MKQLCTMLALMLLLAGCSAAETYETVADELVQSVVAQPRTIRMHLPDEALLPAMESDTGTLYLCADYDVSVQTLPGGDIEQTIRTLTGYEPDALTVMKTSADDLTRYDFVWTSAADEGEQVNRGAILDDGSYHYALTAMIDATLAEAYREIWNGMFESFALD